MSSLSGQQAGAAPGRAAGVLSIDFGTCFSSAGFVWERTAHWVKDPLTAQPHIPTCLFWNGSSFQVGQLAENSQDKDPDCFVREFKRELGRDEPRLLGGRSYLPEELAAVVLRFLREEADRIATGLGAQAFTAARVAVPATYTEMRRQLMIKAARQAGFTSVELIDEPVAAARSYGEQLAEGETLLVYDLGGGTFDATLLRRVGQDYVVVGQPSGSPQLGGVDFDRKIYQDFLAACTDDQRALLESKDPDKRAAHLARINVIDFCRKQKHQLSVEPEAGGSHLLGLDMVDYRISQDRFNVMIAPLVEESLGLCEQMLQEAGVEASGVGRVLMVGGSCRIPFIRQSLSGRFQCPVVLAADPWLAVAAGGMVQTTASASRPQPGRPPLHKPAQGQQGPSSPAAGGTPHVAAPPDPVSPTGPASAASFGNAPVPTGGVPLAPENARLHCLTRPELGGEGFALSKLRILVGRAVSSANSDLNLSTLDDKPPYATSRVHAELVWVNGDLQIRDLGSTNGTWVNGARLPNPEPRVPSPYRSLAVGDRIRLGHLDFELTNDQQ